MLEIWMELHESWLSSRLSLNKPTEQRHKAVTSGEETNDTLEKGLEAAQKEETNHGNSSKIGLALVLNTAMIAGLSSVFGSPAQKKKKKITTTRLIFENKF